MRPFGFSHSRLRSQPTVFSECPSEEGLAVDFDNTYSDPRQPTKSNDITLDLAGTFVEDADVQGLHIKVSVGGVFLYENEYLRKKSYEAGEQYTDKITWYVPGFAPDGEYEIVITIHDNSSTPVNFACVSAKFVFWADASEVWLLQASDMIWYKIQRPFISFLERG